MADDVGYFISQCFHLNVHGSRRVSRNRKPFATENQAASHIDMDFPYMDLCLCHDCSVDDRGAVGRCVLGRKLAEELLSSSLHCSLSDAFWTCIEVLIYLHACGKSIVYGSLTRQFRQGYVRFFRHFFCFGKTNVDYSTGVSENHTGDKHLLRRTQAKETLLKLAFTNPGMDTSDDDSCRHGRYFWWNTPLSTIISICSMNVQQWTHENLGILTCCSSQCFKFNYTPAQ